MGIFDSIFDIDITGDGNADMLDDLLLIGLIEDEDVDDDDEEDEEDDDENEEEDEYDDEDDEDDENLEDED